MLIGKLTLENFKSYVQTTIRFLEGTNAIIGANGAGKSSILEAIGFALFDYQPPGSRLADLLREGANSGSVTVTFLSSYDERDYEVERAFSERATTRYRAYDIDRDRQILAEGGEEVKEWLHQHLNVDQAASLDDLFENTIGVPQGTFTAAFLQPASARKSIFDPLLKVDEYKRASDRLLDTVHHLQEQAETTRRRMANLEGQLEASSKLKLEQEELAKQLATGQEKLDQLRRTAERLRAQLTKVENARKNLERSALALEQARSQNRQLAKQVEQAQTQLSEAQAAEQKVQDTLENHRRYLDTEQGLAELEKQRSARDALQEELNAREKEYARLETRLEALREQRAEAEQARERAASLRPKAERQQALEEKQQKLQQKALQAENLKEQIVHQEKDRNRLEGERDAIEEETRQASAMQDEIERLERDLADIEKEKGGLDRELATIRGELRRLERQSETLQESDDARCPTCETPLTEEHRQRILQRNSQQNETLRQREARIERELDALHQARERKEDQLRSFRQRLGDLRRASDLRRIQARLQEHQDTLSDSRASLAALRQSLRERERISQALETLGDPTTDYRLSLEKAGRIEELDASHQERKAEMRRMDKEIQKTRQALAEYGDLDGDLAALRRERSLYQEAHEIYLQNRSLAKQLEKRQDTLGELEKLAAEQESVLQEREQAHQRAAGAYDERQHRTLEAETQETTERAAQLEGRLEGMAQRLGTVESEIEQLEQLSEELDREEKALTRTNSLLDLVEWMRRLLREAGPYVTRRMVGRISEQASRLYAEIMADHSKRLTWSEDYELSLDAKGRKRIFHQLSGGEQMSAALALRLALLRETSAVDIAFFDEPTAHLDPTRRDGLAEQIVQVKGFSQVFVISHDDTFEQAAQNFIRIVKDRNGSRQE